MAEVEEIEDAVGVDAHGAVAARGRGLLGAAAAAAGGVAGGGIRGGGWRGGGLGALPLPGIGDSRHPSLSLSLPPVCLR